MLKALELVGFKSFADKTRFDFPPGITVVVGPNGSGKSNIVDAMKWVLGEQSAKSLRGKDMADVIFKGTGEGTRRMLNTAEATIIFENADGRLPVEAAEVHVTRRVYRSGEGEYLINGQPCRLKDIKTLFRGTGVGTDAYSLIEQGKVERMLQASPKDRRAIFEEAAGISRFKAKKAEAQRRLLRVEQNLLRLSDIVEEVGSRLRSVRAQASKAQRYREYSDRLQQLRTQVGLADWRELSERLQKSEDELAGYRNLAGVQEAQAESYEARTLELEVELSHLVETVRVDENHIARTRERIATLESAALQGRSRQTELAEVETQTRMRLAALAGRAGSIQQRMQETIDGLHDAEQAFTATTQRIDALTKNLDASTQSLEQLRGENENRRKVHREGMQEVAALASRIASLQSQLDALEQAQQRSRQKLAELTAALTDDRRRRAAARDEVSQAASEVETKRDAVEAARRQLVVCEEEAERRREELSGFKQEFSAASERAAVLQELEKNQEGLTTGVREVLQLAQQAEAGPFSTVQGLVADLLRVAVDVAPLVDVVLGETAQYVAVWGDELLERVRTGKFRPRNRVGFVRIDEPLPSSQAALDLAGRPGVVERLDRLVRAHGRAEPLIQRLLGGCWLVESLQAAAAARTAGATGARFVTRQGEFVDVDGTIVVGPRGAAGTLVSRKSELRDLTHRSKQLATTIRSAEQKALAASGETEQRRQEVADHAGALEAAAQRLAECRLQAQTISDRCDELEKQESETKQESDDAAAAAGARQQELQATHAQLRSAETHVAELDQQLRAAKAKVEALETRRNHEAQQATAAQVERAKNEQLLATLRAQMSQFQADRQERDQSSQRARQELALCLQRQTDATLEILDAGSQIAELYLRREQLEHQVQQQLQLREETAAQKSQLADQLHALRRDIQQRDEQQHRCELTASEVHHQRKTLAERLKEDYGIDISELADPAVEQAGDSESVDQEIADLRRKINNIGAVNMDALSELDELDERFTSLSSQFEDLTQAKESLERIITKINADSRRVFQDTLEAIRLNFQTLYRKSFGGGRADLALEEGVDVLEAGIDIIATPPGKPSFNNSLLSGGEKALTAVALLLAIFQYRPSPFCVLDEVDAPFDEANVGRFIDVLNDFLGWTKFVVVTHSKKTMTAATTLYGVTMQESGVSKRVSVRFEDVSEDGRISQDAIDRDDSADYDAA